MTRSVCLVAVLTGLVLGGCTGPKAPDRPELRALTLPDLSQMAESARKQVEERHAALVRAVANRNTPLLELSNVYGEMGKLLMAAQYADPAESCFLNAQSLDPGEFRWPYYLAHLYRTQGELTKSQSLFERAIQLHPDDVSTLVWLGNTYLEQGLPDAAEPQFAKALSLEPTSISARYGLGRTALAKNDPRRAVRYLEELLEINPKAADAHYPLSLAYTALGDSAKASQHLRLRSSEGIYPADPLMAELNRLLQSPQSYETLGIQALGREDWPAAAAQFRKGLELSPSSPALRFRLATTMNMMGDAAGGEALLKAVVQDAPQYFPAQFSLGVILQANGHHGEAVEHFTAALAQRQDYAEARLRLASSLRRLGRGKESLANYEQVANANPDLVEAHAGYAMTLAQLGRYQEARDSFAQQTALHPDQLSFRHGLARLLVTAHDDRVRDGGRAMSLVQAMMAQGRTPELGETLAMTFAELGQFEQAVALQRDLLRSAERAGVTSVKARLTRNLQLYKNRQPCRTPWSDEEMP